MATTVPKFLSAATACSARRFATLAGSEFIEMVRGSFGKEYSESAHKFCESRGIPVDKLTFIGRGNNTIAFSYQESLVLKVFTDTENIKGILPHSRLSAPTLGGNNLGYDMGGAPINILATPFFDITRTTPAHVRALCQTLLAEGIVLHDNKLENIGISEEGVPVVIDPGALEEYNKHKPPHFIYPQLAGFDPDQECFVDIEDHIPDDVRAHSLENTIRAQELLAQCMRERAQTERIGSHSELERG